MKKEILKQLDHTKFQLKDLKEQLEYNPSIYLREKIDSLYKERLELLKRLNEVTIK